ncbi:hypothetical protein ACFL2T_06095 [Elusimicrobiota bacterium]
MALGLPILLLLAPLLIGCAPTFKYTPNPALTDTKVLPLKVAVLAFKDGTEDFTNSLRGAFVPNGKVNFARVGHGNVFLPPVPPPIMAKALADDLRASGALRAVDFLFDRNAPLEGADILIDGVVKDATFFAHPGQGGWGIRMNLEVTAHKLPTKERILSRTLRASRIESKHPSRTIPEELKKMFAAFRQELLSALSFEKGLSAPDSAPKRRKDSVEDILRSINED